MRVIQLSIFFILFQKFNYIFAIFPMFSTKFRQNLCNCGTHNRSYIGCFPIFGNVGLTYHTADDQVVHLWVLTTAH